MALPAPVMAIGNLTHSFVFPALAVSEAIDLVCSLCSQYWQQCATTWLLTCQKAVSCVQRLGVEADGMLLKHLSAVV